ncbi:MAG: hypothetical protein ABSH52_20975 [Terriglobia bacterium]|jgi:hypothetical protein
MSNEEKHEWDRQPGESSKAYRHFCLYRDAGKERSLRKLAAVANTTSNLRQLQHWSSRWRGVDRCTDYDDYMYDQMRLQCERERLDMHKRHAKIAVLGQGILIKGMEELLAKVQTGKQDLTPSDLARLMHVSTELERFARGDAVDELTGPEGSPVVKIHVVYGDDKPKLLPNPKEQRDGEDMIRPLYLQR